jgi:phosphoenolpyruvate synthase/pyruvate phosphate dikinase
MMMVNSSASMAKKIRAEFRRLRNNSKSLAATGKALRTLVLKGKFPERVEQQIREAYRDLCEGYKNRNPDRFVETKKIVAKAEKR